MWFGCSWNMWTHTLRIVCMCCCPSCFFFNYIFINCVALSGWFISLSYAHVTCNGFFLQHHSPLSVRWFDLRVWYLFEWVPEYYFLVMHTLITCSVFVWSMEGKYVCVCVGGWDGGSGRFGSGGAGGGYLGLGGRYLREWWRGWVDCCVVDTVAWKMM